MSYEHYVEKSFHNSRLELIQVMDRIINDYIKAGYVMTVRQLYYQLVAREIIPNNEKTYKMITSLVNDARLAGLLPWDGIEDRTRSFIRRGHWGSPGDIVDACVHSFYMDMWVNQKTRVYAIVEKEALAGVLEHAANKYDVPLLAARGYPSSTVVRAFVEDDILPAIRNGQRIEILHLGDHDPSGIDMSRDLEERIKLFARTDDNFDINFTRIALSMDQIDEIKPPENPAKTTDARFREYRKKYGDSSWELDALTPTYLNDLLSKHITQHIDDDAWEIKEKEILSAKEQLKMAKHAIEKGWTASMVASHHHKGKRF